MKNKEFRIQNQEYGTIKGTERGKDKKYTQIARMRRDYVNLEIYDL